MLSDDDLAEARALLYEDEGVGDLGARLTSEWAAIRYNAAVNVSGRKLLAEIERLRAENAAMREVAQAVADDHRHDWQAVDPQEVWACEVCGERSHEWAEDVQRQARALLAGEAEGTGE